MERVIGGIERRVLKRVRAVALVFPAAPLDFGADLGDLPGGDRSTCSTSCPRRSCRSATAHSSAACSWRRKARRPSRCTRTRLQSEEALHANPAVDMTFTMTGKQRFLSRRIRDSCWRFLKDPDQRPPIQAVAGQLMGAINSRVPGTADVPAAQSGAADQHRRHRESRRASSPTRFPGSIRTRCMPSAGQVDAEDVRVSRISVRQLRSVQPHAEPAGGHAARSGQAVRRFGDAHSRLCCTTRIRRTTPI